MGKHSIDGAGALASPGDSQIEQRNQALGIIHNLRRHSILWNEELDRVLIIDFYRSVLKCPSTSKRSRTERRLCQSQEMLNVNAFCESLLGFA